MAELTRRFERQPEIDIRSTLLNLIAGTITDDVSFYAAGSLLQGLDPTRNVVELTNEPV